MKINNLSYLFVAGALALASCSHDEYSGPDYAGGKLSVLGTINQINTRANNADWEPGDEIGVSSDGGHDNVHFATTDGDGVFSSETPAYVLGAGETKFTAYYPHHTAASADTPELSFSEPMDYMHASTTATRENPVANFVFSHKMSKISFKILDQAVKTGSGTVRLDGVILDGKFHTLTGEVTAGNAKTSTTKNFNINTTTDFILPPLADGTGQVSVTLNYQGKVYGGFISVSKLNAGNEYQYTIDLTDADPAFELKISSATISDWNKNEGGNVDMEEKDPSDVEAGENETLEVGDFLLSDGSTLDKNDAAVANYKGKIVGVVYYVGNADLANFGYSVKNGLAIAVKDAGQARWGTGNTDYSAWGKEGDNGHPEHLGNLSISEMGVGGSGPKTNQMMGYNNTLVFITAQQDFMDDDVKAGNEGKYTHSQEMLDLLAEANKSGVSGASSWYLPNFSEFYVITENLSAINKSLQAAGGDQLVPLEGNFSNSSKNEDFTTEGYYWTSTLRGSSNGWVSILNNDEDVKGTLSITRNSNGTKGTFRFAIAF